MGNRQLVNVKQLIGFLVILFFVTLTLCACGSNSVTINNKKAASLDEFKEACAKHGYQDKLQPLTSADNKLIGYSISVDDKDKPTNLIFYDVQKEENLGDLYSKEEASITGLSQKENISADFKEDTISNYIYKKATNFKVKLTDKLGYEKFPLKLAYCIKVDSTCLYAVLYENEYDDLNSVINDIGYGVS